MNISFVSTYPPIACGLATYTQDLLVSLRAQDGVSTSVVALTDELRSRSFSNEVEYEIRKRERRDYTSAAEFLSGSGADVISLQHEFGIFGGQEGSYVVDFLDRLRKPVVTTLHTVLPNPLPAYRTTLVAIAERSEHLVVMSQKGRELLRDIYELPVEQISVIHHGVPDIPFEEPDCFKTQLGFEERTVIMTFGLLGPGKGIELVLEALPKVVQHQPEVLYVVLGATHPEVKRRDGEKYRQQLQERVDELGLHEHVRFVNAYVDRQKLHDYLQACDIYVTPYPGRGQISSGTLAFAMGAGKAIISTPYLYAEELLGEGRGWLIDFDDAGQMQQALQVLAGDPERRRSLQKAAYAFGRQMRWPEVRRRYLDVFSTFSRRHYEARERPPVGLAGKKMQVRLDHLEALTDDTGIFQHASYGIPDRRHGYCTDDVARALMVVMLHHHRHANRRSLRLARIYMSFLQHAQRGDGHFHNFMSYDRQFIDTAGSEDTVGRALWGLGAVVAWGSNPATRVMARQMLERGLAVPLHHPRALAYALAGLHLYLQRFHGSLSMRAHMKRLADQLVAMYRKESDEEWRWFHDEVTYGNAKLPQALLLAYEILGDPRYEEIGLASLSFLLENTYHDEYFDFIGNQGWYRRGRKRAIFGQQPIEAGYMTEACMKAYDITGNKRYYHLAQAAIEWFFGRNRLGRQLYDSATGVCADGLESWGSNRNQGAESVVACLLGLLCIIPAEKASPINQQAANGSASTSLRRTHET